MSSWPGLDPVTVCLLAIGAITLGLLGLLARTAPGRWRLQAGALGAVAAAAGTVAGLGLAPVYWLSPLVLAGVCLGFLLLRTPALGRACAAGLGLLTWPRVQWGALLV